MEDAQQVSMIQRTHTYTDTFMDTKTSGGFASILCRRKHLQQRQDPNSVATSQLRLAFLLLRLDPLLQHSPQNLPARTLRHFFNESDATSQLLVMRNLLTQPLNNLLCIFGCFVRRFARLRVARVLSEFVVHDVRARDFGMLRFVLDANDSDVVDQRVIQEFAFEFGGGDLHFTSDQYMHGRQIKEKGKGEFTWKPLYLINSFTRSVM